MLPRSLSLELPSRFTCGAGRRERADLAQRRAVLERERLDRLEVGARGRLIAPQAREPRVVVLEGAKERSDLVPRAAVVRARLPEADRRLGRAQRDEIQVPAL